MIYVVFVHYRLPEQRLRDHFRWNDEIYRTFQVRVIVVSDIEREVPDYATCAAYREPMPVFSLAKTKNFGLSEALRTASDSDIIAMTDADIAWEDGVFFDMHECIHENAIIPLYFMAQDYDARHDSFPDPGCGGTVAMQAAHWRRTRYDERYVGYGGEDGRMRKDIVSMGLRERRDCRVYHIAHDPTADQHNVPGHGRTDAWNRDTGFNPDMFHINKDLYNS